MTAKRLQGACVYGWQGAVSSLLTAPADSLVQVQFPETCSSTLAPADSLRKYMHQPLTRRVLSSHVESALCTQLPGGDCSLCQVRPVCAESETKLQRCKLHNQANATALRKAVQRQLSCRNAFGRRGRQLPGRGTGCDTGCLTGCYTGCLTGRDTDCRTGCYTGCLSACFTGCYTGCYTGCRLVVSVAVTLIVALTVALAV